MKTSIFVKNTKGAVFEFDNTKKCTLNIANKSNSNVITCEKIEVYDIIYFTQKGTMIKVQNCKTEEQAYFIIEIIKEKLKEKSDLLRQIQTLKKIKNLDFTVLDKLNQEIRDKYFEIKIEDILKS